VPGAAFAYSILGFMSLPLISLSSRRAVPALVGLDTRKPQVMVDLPVSVTFCDCSRVVRIDPLASRCQARSRTVGDDTGCLHHLQGMDADQAAERPPPSRPITCTARKNAGQAHGQTHRMASEPLALSINSLDVTRMRHVAKVGLDLRPTLSSAHEPVDATSWAG
jgi:hypothetical protein